MFDVHVQTAPSEGPSIWRISLHKVEPESFDLLMHFVVHDSIELESSKPNTIDRHSGAITALLDLLPAASELGLEAVKLQRIHNEAISKLRALLSDAPLSLKPIHIKKAYEMEDGKDFRELCVQASVRTWIQHFEDEYADNDDEEVDIFDESNNPARKSKPVSNPLRLVTQRIPRFRRDLALEILEVTSHRHAASTRRTEVQIKVLGSIPLPRYYLEFNSLMENTRSQQLFTPSHLHFRPYHQPKTATWSIIVCLGECNTCRPFF